MYSSSIGDKSSGRVYERIDVHLFGNNDTPSFYIWRNSNVTTHLQTKYKSPLIEIDCTTLES